MKQEFSAGLVVFTIVNQIRKYLLLYYQAGHWDFPKGHIENNESKVNAAQRELMEETGLTVQIIPSFESSFSYYFHDPTTNELCYKTVYFFIGKAITTTVTLSLEHVDFVWLPYKEALEKLTFKNAKALLEKVENVLKKSKKDTSK